MSTVVARTIRSSPHRDTSATWSYIVDLLTQGRDGAARQELLSIEGVAAAIIAERAPNEAAIVVTCDGPRTRIYCCYDEAATTGTDAREDALGFDPLQGQWHISLPCPADDLAWVQRELKKKSQRVTARDMKETLGEDSADVQKAESSVTLDLEAFLKS